MRPALLAAVSLTLVFLACVWPALGAFFTADDFVCLVRSRAPDPVQALRYFGLDWGGSANGGLFYRPLGNVSLSLDGWLFGLRPAAFRLSSILLHLVVTVLVGFVGWRRWGLSARASVLAGALFLLHPLHDQAVLWIAARTDLLCAIFALLAFDAATGERGAWRSIPLFAAALASKESAIVVPALVLVHAVLVAPFGERWGRVWRRVGALGVVALLYLGLRRVVLGDVVGQGAALFSRGGTALVKGMAKLVLWIVVPFDSSALEGALRRFPGGLPVVALLALAALAGGLIALRHRPRALGCALWVLAALLPVLARPNAWYIYLPSVGFCWLAAQILDPSPATGPGARVLAAAVLALFALGLAVNARRFRAAADLAERVVSSLAAREGTVLVVNAPSVLYGRYPILTSPAQYTAALTVVGGRAAARPVTQEHLRTGREPLLSRWRDGRLVVEMETSEDAFFALDELVVPLPERVRPGQVLEGDGVGYRVERVDARGRIAALSVLGLPPLLAAGAQLVAFDGRSLTPLDAAPPRPAAQTTAGSSGVPVHFSSTSAPPSVTVMMSSWRMPISPGM